MTYQHPSKDPNLNNLHHAMEYRDGLPHLRVNLGSDNITINGDVNIPTPLEVLQSTDSTPWIISKDNNLNGPTNAIFVKVTNDVIAINDNNDSLTVDGTVELGTTTLNALENITVSGTVELGTTTLNALETITVNQGTTPWQISRNNQANSASNRIYVSMETDTVLADSNYYMNVARGLVDTHTPVFRSAYISDTPSIETSVWVEGGIYPYSTWTSASILYIASSSTADTSLQIYIEGLDASYNNQTETVTTNATNGQTTVTTTKQYLRIQRATIVNNNANSANAGDIRFRITSAAGTVVAHMAPGFGITKLSQYTVPAGFTAYILYGDVASFKSGAGNQGCRVKFMVRPYQQSFIVGTVALASNGLYRNDFTVPFKVTEKSDIDVRVLTDSSGAQVSASYEMILIPN